MVDKIGVEAAAFNLFRGEAAGELMNDCGHHFDMRQFLCTDIGQDPLDLRIRHAVTLLKVAGRGAEFSVRTADLGDNKFCERRVGIFNLNRILQFLFI